jgi:hypothetical protein
MYLLIQKKLFSVLFLLRIHFINYFKYVIQFRQSIRLSSAGCASNISAPIPFIIPYAPVSNTVNIGFRFFIGVLQFGITGNLEHIVSAILTLRVAG